MYRNLANIITLTRILFSMLLLFTAAFSWDFYLCYLICGISDMLDGSVARYFHTESETGSKLDSLADFVFFALLSVKLVRDIKISSIFMAWSGLFFAVRFICT
ncbi:MAG: CDP-alcohol phosphatidyltransferase family protein, partial [Erysipelotrichaceae bacterium]|nr:CDP-alcohol phosphatidyltransferase family protein [Erysipelotrichaceae bacterium]